MTYFLFPLPGLSRVKSGRACHSARPRSGRSSRKTSTGHFLVAHHPPAGAFYAPAQSVAPRFPEHWAKWHFPWPTAFGLLGNKLGNSAPQSFLSVWGFILRFCSCFQSSPNRPAYSARSTLSATSSTSPGSAVNPANTASPKSGGGRPTGFSGPSMRRGQM